MNIRALSLKILLLWSGIILSVSATAIPSAGCDAPLKASDGYTRMVRLLDKQAHNHRPASELKSYLEKARATAKPGDLEALKRLAWWCRQKGLFEEMFLFFDDVIAVEPEDEDVQTFIDEMAATIEFDAFRARSNHDPHSVLGLFRATAARGPTLARIGRSRVREFDAPLRSRSGATTVTSANEPSVSASADRPRDW